MKILFCMSISGLAIIWLVRQSVKFWTEMLESKLWVKSWMIRFERRKFDLPVMISLLKAIF